MRKNNNVFAGNKIEILNTGSDHVLGYLRVYQNKRAIVLCNFSEEKQTISGNFLRLFGFSTRFINLGSGDIISSDDLLLEPYDFVCLMPHQA
jgi:amylosucrase